MCNGGEWDSRGGDVGGIENLEEAIGGEDKEAKFKTRKKCGVD